MQPHRPELFAAALLTVLAVAGSAAATNGTQPIGVGARDQARGGTGIGLADDASTLHRNPAGLAFIDGQRFDGSMGVVVPSVSVDGPVDAADSEVPFLPTSAFGIAFDFDEDWQLGEALTFGEGTPSELPSRFDPEYGTEKHGGSGWKFGIGVFPVAGNKIDLEYATPFWDADAQAGLAREPQDWEADFIEAALTIGAAYRINRFISIGVAPSFIYSRLELDTPLAQPTSNLQGHPFVGSDLTYADLAPFLGTREIEGFSDLDDASTFGFRARVGITINPFDWMTIGLTYATQAFMQDHLGEARLTFDRQIQKVESSPVGQSIRALVEANTGIPAAQQSYAGEGNVRLSPLAQPQEVGFGVGLFFYPVSIALDVKWLNWSETFDAIEGRISEFSSRELAELTEDGATTTHIRVPLDWDDQIVFALGLAVAVTDWMVVRAGYNYGKNPVPDDTILPTAPAILEHHITGGFSFYVRRVELSVAFEYDVPNEVRIDNHRAMQSLNGTTIEVSAYWVAAALSLRF